MTKSAMIAQSPRVAARALTIDQIQVDQDSLDILRHMRQEHIDNAKVVLAVSADTTMLAIGWKRHFHVAIVERASQSLFDRTFVTSTDPGSARPLPGITIQGAHFSVNWDSGKAQVYLYSDTFGGFKDGLFTEPTAALVEAKLSSLATGLLRTAT